MLHIVLIALITKGGGERSSLYVVVGRRYSRKISPELKNDMSPYWWNAPSKFCTKLVKEWNVPVGNGDHERRGFRGNQLQSCTKLPVLSNIYFVYEIQIVLLFKVMNRELNNKYLIVYLSWFSRGVILNSILISCTGTWGL